MPGNKKTGPDFPPNFQGHAVEKLGGMTLDQLSDAARRATTAEELFTISEAARGLLSLVQQQAERVVPGQTGEKTQGVIVFSTIRDVRHGVNVPAYPSVQYKTPNGQRRTKNLDRKAVLGALEDLYGQNNGQNR